MSELEQQRLSACFARDEVCVLGLPFDRVDEHHAMVRLDSAIDRDERCFLSTPNLNFVISALNDGSFRESVFQSDLSVADGMPLIWVSRLIGANLRQRVAGSTLFDLMRNRPKQERISVFFLGGMGNDAELAAEKLEKYSVGFRSTGGLNPGMGSVEDMSSEEIIRSVNDANPDFLVVSLGAKKGQRWIMENQDRLNTRVISHLGAVVNFVAGTVKRAPHWWQKLGLEWVWRIVEEPTLWKRYFFDGLALLKLIAIRVLPLCIYGGFLRTKFKGQPLMHSICHPSAEVAHLSLSGSAVDSNLQALREAFPREVMENQTLVIDLQGLDHADASFWALMLRVKTELSEAGKRMRIERAPKRIAYLAKLSLVDNTLGF